MVNIPAGTPIRVVMADTVMMPKLGFDMAEGTLVRWVIAEGQPVTKGAVLAEIETAMPFSTAVSASDLYVRRFRGFP